MKTVRIIYGTYGYHVNGRVKPIRPGNEPIEVQDKEAERLVSLSVAEYVNDISDNENFNVDIEVQDKEADEIITTNLDRAQLETMKLEDLKLLASDMGIDIKGLKKAEIIDLVIQVEVQVNAKDVTDEPPAGFPKLDAEAPE